ncbi:MAG: MJ0042-type zinc finger domain-containing protein, partial [Pseudolabrys sp.]
MLIACPNCSTSYMIDPASLGEAGRTVRCARCKT